MEESKMKKHVTAVGSIQIAFSVLGLIGAFVVFFALNFARGFVDNDEIATMVLRFIGTILPLIIGLASALGLVGAIALLSYQPWARILVIVVAALGCLNIPIGTLVGVYSIWVLMQDETVKLFKAKNETM
jgi:mannitol-specific phosphotransferase system IIBC component